MVRIAGLLGGIGPESTIEYYRLLVAGYRRRAGADRYPPIVIDSIDLTKMLALIGAGELEAVTDFLLAEIRRLAGAGADFAGLASDTPPIVYRQPSRRSP